MSVTPQELNITATMSPNLDIAETDPAHPRNLLYTTAALQQQAIVDTKYDVLQPTIKEHFYGKNQNNNHAIVTIGAGIVAIVLGGIVYVMS